MESPSILHQGKNPIKKEQGFTLIEIIISIGILAVIFSIGLFLSFDFYQSYAIHSEKNTIISVLQKARSESLNNIGQARHGVHFQASPKLQYIIFECPPKNPQCSEYIQSPNDNNIDSSYGISLVFPSPTETLDVIFDQLSGDCVTCQNSDITIGIKNKNNAYEITTNSEGAINY